MCDNRFLLTNLSGSSYANENFITNECISNWVKFGIFLFWIVVWSCSWLWIVSITFLEIKKSGIELNLRKKIFFLSVLGSSAALTSHIILFLDIQISLRYFFFAIYPWVAGYGTNVVMSAAFNSAIEIMLKNDREKLKNRFQIAVYVVDAITAFIVIVFFIIGPITAYSLGNWYLVNIFYIIRNCSVSFVVFLFCAIIWYATKSLTAACHLDAEDVSTIDNQNRQKINDLVKRINVFNFFCNYGTLPIKIILFFMIPIWQIWDLYGIFWFQFIIDDAIYFGLINFLVWMLKDNNKMDFSTSSQYKQRDSKNLTDNATNSKKMTPISKGSTYSNDNANENDVVVLGEKSYTLDELQSKA